jgi:hypothetical protein
MPAAYIALMGYLGEVVVEKWLETKIPRKGRI